MHSQTDYIAQAAAIPVRDGTVCLVTSQSGNHWVVPKGSLEPGLTAAETALKEAWEEAGLAGTLDRDPVGTYLYEKSGNCYHVTVFLMQVTAASADWPERELRVRRWVRPQQAIAWVRPQALRGVLCKALATDPVLVLD
jgi:8-oxo-dGTP pyrophosphatase MutT (NUDIX family)